VARCSARGLGYEPFAQAAIARLDEIRLAALELRIDADLALGRHTRLIAELEALVAEHPLRERLRGYLMTRSSSASSTG
jgi:DNA-binding SARP family transcriptional activator